MNTVINQLFSLSFFEKAAAFSLPDTLLILLVSCLIGLFIAALYRVTYQGVMYTLTYGVTLVGVTMISAGQAYCWGCMYLFHRIFRRGSC